MAAPTSPPGELARAPAEPLLRYEEYVSSLPRPPKLVLTSHSFISSGVFTLHVGPSRRRFDIHKALLGAASPEFKKHVYNDMIEGTSGHMTLSDEREDTITRFIQWAYTGDYPSPGAPTAVPISPEPGELAVLFQEKEDSSSRSSEHEPEEDGDPLLMAHARLYVFAERFNIQQLKQQTFEKLTTGIVAVGVPMERESKVTMIYLISYAFGNLPKCLIKDRLLEYLGLYASWTLESLRMEPEFFELLQTDIDFVKELFVHVRRGNKAPWGAGTSEDKLIHRCLGCQKKGKTEYDYPVNIKPKKCGYCWGDCKLFVDGEPLTL